MKVTFIEHSSFMVEMEQNVLLFDSGRNSVI